jgi:PIN domain nuclease of toxin-antitoxin system
MRLLLDTHTFLWFIDGNPKLSSYARQLIEELGNERLLSVASLWEMSIKNSLGKLKLLLPFTPQLSSAAHSQMSEFYHPECASV